MDEKSQRYKQMGMGELSDNASSGLGIKYGHMRAARALHNKIKEVMG